MTDIEKVMHALDWLEHWEIQLAMTDCREKLPAFIRSLDIIKFELTTTTTTTGTEEPPT
jgi:hypothetical protein